MKDVLSVQRHVRAKGEIKILNGNEMYNVPIVTVPTLKRFFITVVDICVTVTDWTQLRHGMDMAVMFCSNANSEYTICIQS